MAWVVWTLTAALVAATLAPYLRIPHGAVRVLSFARQQVIVLALAAMALAVVAGQAVVLTVLAVVVVLQVIPIARFLPHGRVQSLPASPEERADAARGLRILTANVKRSNRAFGRLIALVKAHAPDLVVLIEPDAAWLAALEPLHGRYPHRAERPLDTGYGMALWSKRPFLSVDWRELLVAGVPSLRAAIRLDDEAVRIYVLHPEPPVPWHDTRGRDAEIGLVGIEAARDPLPAIVTGDLNDVAWSHTTRRFQRLSGHLDPRVGRGLFNSFHAGRVWMRWPLDHLFHDPRFRLVAMQRLPAFGSDHFAMLFALALAQRPAADAAPDAPAAGDRRDIAAMADTEKARDRPPIGKEWERTRDA